MFFQELLSMVSQLDDEDETPIANILIQPHSFTEYRPDRRGIEPPKPGQMDESEISKPLVCPVFS